jgi:hypothetical protein
MLASLLVSVYLDPGTVISVTATVSATGDASGGNNTRVASVVVPEPPYVLEVRSRNSPFRVEIVGEYLPVQPVGVVYVGSDNGFDGFEPTVTQELGKIVLTDPSLKKRFPRGIEVPIYLVNAAGGITRVTYTRP